MMKKYVCKVYWTLEGTTYNSTILFTENSSLKAIHKKIKVNIGNYGDSIKDLKIEINEASQN